MRARRELTRGIAVGALGALCLGVATVGVATAANGGSLILGHGNSATKTTTLTDHDGTPLALVGKTSKPPLTVNSSKEVAHLNSALLGGKSATALSTYGSGAQINSFEPGTLSDTYTAATVVASTATLATGTYYVDATAVVDGSTGGFGECAVGMSPNLSNDPTQGGGDIPGTTRAFVQAAETAVIKLTHAAKINEYCAGPSGSTALGVGILATRVLTSKPGSTR
jgi:hypothetical protein